MRQGAWPRPRERAATPSWRTREIERGSTSPWSPQRRLIFLCQHDCEDTGHRGLPISALDFRVLIQVGLRRNQDLQRGIKDGNRLLQPHRAALACAETPERVAE